MKKLKKYLLFAGSKHYPRGGFRDFMESFDTIEDIMDRIKYYDHDKRGYLFMICDPYISDEVQQRFFEWVDIIDSYTGEDVSENILKHFKPN